MECGPLEHGKPKSIVAVTLLIIAVALFIFSSSGNASKDILRGKVQEVTTERDAASPINGKPIREQDLTVLVDLGKEKKEVQILNDFMPVKRGDTVFVRRSPFESNEDETTFDIIEVSRSKGILTLAALFVSLVLLTGGIRGLYSLIGLVVSFSVIVAYIVPNILGGADPVFTGLVGSSFILLPTLYLTHGLNKKASAAFLGILLALLCVGIFSNSVVRLLDFSGFTGEESLYLSMETAGTINLVGLLIAGIIIAAVGVLDDVAITQASTVFSMAAIDPNLRGWRLYRKAMEVGKDHISAVVNTLILAYTGAALPLILLLSLRRVPFSYFVSTELVAEEIVRTLISSSGLLLAVPLTTAISILFMKKDERNYNSKEIKRGVVETGRTALHL